MKYGIFYDPLSAPKPHRIPKRRKLPSAGRDTRPNQPDGGADRNRDRELEQLTKDLQHLARVRTRLTKDEGKAEE